MKKAYILPTVSISIVLLDILFIIIADLVSFIIRFNGTFPPDNFNAYLELAVFIIALRISSIYIFHLYERPKYKSNFEIFVTVVKATTASSIIIIFTIYFMDIVAYPRLIASLSWLLTIVFISMWRFILKDFLRLYFGENFLRSNLLIIGTGRDAYETAVHALRDASIEYNFIGYLHVNRNSPTEVSKDQVLGDLEDLPKILKEYRVDEIIMAESDINREKMSALMSVITQKRIPLKSIPASYETIINDIVLHEHGIPFIGPTTFTKSASWYWGLKRILDILFSLLILIITSPLLIATAIAIKITSPGPVIYLQKRVGLNGAKFTMLKFRTMRADAEKGGRPRWAREKDKRVTPIGMILRRFRIDELPQLINVLRGEMSIIGPRPERPYFVSRLMKKMPFYAERLKVKPSITGWAQVNFKYTATEEDARKKLLYDIFYVQNMSLALDALIALKTLKVIITGKGAQ
ncbi:MAG: sugar transferase [Candidatus Omnitrophica bacterium]|nr:sugar transferase [Candidatus Omnitrophota bacterium]